MRMFTVAVVTIVIIAVAGSIALKSVQEPVAVAFTTAGARPDIAE